jgi:membrane-associated phospholipid phosphatase
MRVDDIVSISVAFLYVVPIVRYLITQHARELIAFWGLLGTTILNESLKHYVIGKRSPRPADASNCNLWANDGKQGGKPGMPSGHSAQVSFFVGYYAQQTTSPLLRALLLLYGIAVMISRYTKQCHTLGQILSGSALGFSISYLMVRHL